MAVRMCQLAGAKWPADTPGKGSGLVAKSASALGVLGSCARGQIGMIRLGKIRSSEISHTHDCANRTTDNLHQFIVSLSIFRVSLSLCRSSAERNRHDPLRTGPVALTVPVLPAAT